MASRWILRLGLALLLPALAAAAWFSIPLFVSPKDLAEGLKASLAERGLRLGFERAASMAMDPMPGIDLGPVTVTDQDGRLVLRAEQAEARPSAWMLVGGHGAVGTLSLAEATLELPATLVSDKSRLEDAVLTLNHGPGGALGGKFTGTFNAQPLSGTYGIGNLDALLSGQLSAVTVAVSSDGSKSAFEGTVRHVADAIIPDLIGTFTHHVEDPKTHLLDPNAFPALRGLEAISLTARLNAKADALAIQAQLVSALQERSLNISGAFKGDQDWTTTGDLSAEITARAGGLLSAQYAGRIDWRAPFSAPLQGEGQLVALEVPELLDLLGLGSGLAGLSLPRVARIKGDLSWADAQLDFERTKVEYDGASYQLAGALSLADARPKLALETELEAMALADLGEIEAALGSLAKQPADISARLGVQELRVGRHAASTVQLAIDARPASASATMLSASIPGGKASGRLSLNPTTDEVNLTLEINGADMSPLTGGELSGAGVGRIELQWSEGEVTALQGRGELSVYAGTLSRVDLGSALAGQTQQGKETRFATLSGEFGIEDRIVEVTALSVTGAGWAADGQVTADLSAGTVAGNLVPRDGSGSSAFPQSISGALATPVLTPNRIEPTEATPPQAAAPEEPAIVAETSQDPTADTRLAVETELTATVQPTFQGPTPPIPPRAPR